jgi:hypothetical protein
MQTFVPIASTDYSDIAKVLDNKRLLKQALEGWQILMVLEKLNPEGQFREPKGWVNHPAVKMWRGHTPALYRYVNDMLHEASNRGIDCENLRQKVVATMQAVISRETSALIRQHTLDTGIIPKEQEYGMFKDKVVTKLVNEMQDNKPIWQKHQEYYEVVASTHRRALLCKNYEHYSQFGWPEDTGVAPTEYEYLWPVQKEKVNATAN